jgi:hypothetical protein
MFIYVLSCIIVYLLQGRVMEQPFYKHRPRLSMTQFYEGIGPIAFKGRQIRMWNWHVLSNVMYYNEC